MLASAPHRPTPQLADVGDISHAVTVAVRVVEELDNFLINLDSDTPGLARMLEVHESAKANPIIAEMLDEGRTSADIDIDAIDHIFASESELDRAINRAEVDAASRGDLDNQTGY